MWAIGDPSGPIENGITYMVRSVEVSMAVKSVLREWLPQPPRGGVMSGCLPPLGDGHAIGREAGRPHVDLRPEAQAGRPSAVVGVEDHALALPEHAEHGPH